MAAVFMISTSTVVIFTGIAPRWVAFAGFGLALLLLFVNSLLPWIFAGFPLWVFLISVCLLVDEHRRRPQASLASSG
jgi:type IV secretory pathway TrbD component